MNFKVEHAIIAVLVLALLYYVYKHQSLLSDLRGVPHDNNPHLKAVKEKHSSPTAQSEGFHVSADLSTACKIMMLGTPQSWVDAIC